MKNITLSYEEYERLEHAIKGLGWVWQTYQREVPDGWYEFKYHVVLRRFIADELEENLLAQVTRYRFFKRVKVPRAVYRELTELAGIYEELNRVLAYPPYGDYPLPTVVDESKKEEGASR